MVVEPRRAAYTPTETGRLLGGIGRDKVFDLIRDGELRSFKTGKYRLIPRSEIDEFIARKLAEEHMDA
jgi:excisionase family DNA binding protein